MVILIDNIKKGIFLLFFLVLTVIMIYFISLNKTKTLFYNFREYMLSNDIKSLQVLLDDRLKKRVLNKIFIKVISEKLESKNIEKISIDGFNIGKKIIFSKVYFSDGFIDFSITHINGNWVISQINFSH